MSDGGQPPSSLVQFVLLVPGLQRIGAIVLVRLLLPLWKPDVVWFRVQLDTDLGR